jgi:hypothetical protein
MWHWIHVRASYAKPAAAPHRAQKTAEKGSPLRFEADAVCVPGSSSLQTAMIFRELAANARNGGSVQGRAGRSWRDDPEVLSLLPQ